MAHVAPDISMHVSMCVNAHVNKGQPGRPHPFCVHAEVKSLK